MAETILFNIPKIQECHIDNVNLLNALSGISGFTYIPNPGNMGDMLIAFATLGFFDANGIKYSMYDGKNIGDYVVYGGGGIWTADYKEHWKNFLPIFKSAKKIVILPSSFYDCQDLIDVLDERFIVFCREKQSFDYMQNAKTPAKIILDHDMAFRITDNMIKRKLDGFADELALCNKLHETNIKDTMWMIRKDCEGSGKYNSDIDLSSYVYGSDTASRVWIDTSAMIMLDTVARAHNIITDRLHVGIAGMLVGRQVYLIDNSYKKVSNVYNHSMKHYENVHFMKTIDLYSETDSASITKYAFFDNKKYYFKFPLSVQEDLTDLADPFIYAMAFPMMRIGGDFIINSMASRSVIDNITMFCRIWNCWFPGIYKPVNIIAYECPDNYRPENKKLITAFSGGLDAAYTAYKYKKHLDSRFHYDLDKSVMIYGADIPLNQKEQFDNAFESAKRMTDDIGIELVPVETNYRDYQHNWEHEFFCIVTGILNFFSKTYANAAACDSSAVIFHVPWGANPVTDKYLSNNTMRFIPDGYEHTRTQRAWFLKDWTVCIENLRVCWRNADKSKNCGKCEKCVRTKLNFLSVGQNHMSCMPNDVNMQELKDLKSLTASQCELFQEIYDYAKQNHTLNKNWLKLIKKKLREWSKDLNKPHHHSLWWHLKKMKF